MSVVILYLGGVAQTFVAKQVANSAARARDNKLFFFILVLLLSWVHGSGLKELKDERPTSNFQLSTSKKDVAPLLHYSIRSMLDVER
jgi:hypothetical protein